MVQPFGDIDGSVWPLLYQYRQIRIALHSNLACHDIAEYLHQHQAPAPASSSTSWHSANQ